MSVIPFAREAANIAMETDPLHHEQLRSLSIIQRAVVSGLDEQAVLQLIADEACRLTQPTQVAIFVLEGDTLRIVATSGKSGPRSSIDVRIPLAGSLVEAAIVSGQVERVANAREDAHVTAEPRRAALIESLASTRCFLRHLSSRVEPSGRSRPRITSLTVLTVQMSRC